MVRQGCAERRPHPYRSLRATTSPGRRLYCRGGCRVILGGRILKGLTTDSSVVELERSAGRSPAASACEPYRELIELGLRQGRTVMAMWQDLVDDHGFEAKYESVKRFVRSFVAPTSRRPFR